MAPPPAPANADASNVPLADHFFIAGIEPTQIYDERLHRVSSPPPVEETIDEDVALETDTLRDLNIRPDTPTSTGENGTPRRSQRYSWEARKSIGSMIGPFDFKPPASNRSSGATIKGIQVDTTPGLSDEDFEQALRKFASERDTFLEEIQVQAGAVIPQKPSKQWAKVMRISQHEEPGSPGSGPRTGLGSGIGSIRRRLSTMNPRRQASTASRAGKLKSLPEEQKPCHTSTQITDLSQLPPGPQNDSVGITPSFLRHSLSKRVHTCIL